MISSLLGDIRAFVFLVLGFGFAVADLWQFHQLDKQTDLTILLAVLAAAGITVAHTAGATAASGANPPTPAPPPL